MQNILVPIDLAQEGSWDEVLHQAVDFARNGGTLHLLAVVPELSAAGLPSPNDFGVEVPSLAEYNAKVKEVAGKRLDSMIKDDVPGGTKTSTMVVTGHIHREILKAAEEVKADMIVMGARPPSLTSYFLGITAERVAHQADCSVCIVRPKR